MRYELILDGEDEEQTSAAVAPSPLPRTAWVTVCNAIEPDTRQWDGVSQIADRYAVLTKPLPLAGADTLRTTEWRARHHRSPSRRRAMARTRHRAHRRAASCPALGGKAWVAIRSMVLVGAPGTGKSHLARLIVETAGTGSAILSMGGIWDGSILTGSPRSYTGPSPCFPVTVMAQTRTANPIIVGAEIEKVATDHRGGHPHAALLNLIEPSTAAAFYDKCLLAMVDVSHACWLFTANTLDGISARSGRGSTSSRCAGRARSISRRSSLRSPATSRAAGASRRSACPSSRPSPRTSCGCGSHVPAPSAN